MKAHVREALIAAGDGFPPDRIIADPILNEAFLAKCRELGLEATSFELNQYLAAELAPGYSVLQYRWAALSLRKARRLRPELLARLAPTAPQFLGVIDKLDPTTITTGQGLYIFHDPQAQATLYVGEAQNLRKRLEKHLDHSDNKSLARWLWEHGGGTICLEIHLLANETASPVRKALEAELIEKRHPRFNIQQRP